MHYCSWLWGFLSKPDDVKLPFKQLGCDRTAETDSKVPERHDVLTEVWQDVSLRRHRCVWNRCTVAHSIDQNRDREKRRMAENCLSALQWWISSEAGFITHLPVWISASKGRSCRTAAEIWLFSNFHKHIPGQFCTVNYAPCPSKDFRTLFTLYLQQIQLAFCVTNRIWVD